MDTAIRDKAVSLIQASLPDVIAIYQFGSSVRETTHSESDLDLAVLPAHPLTAEVRWDIAQQLSIELRRDVDFVDLLSASTVMRMQVISQGRVLYEADATARQEFEMVTFSAYALLNEERAAILNDIQERGRVYGR